MGIAVLAFFNHLMDLFLVPVTHLQALSPHVILIGLLFNLGGASYRYGIWTFQRLSKCFIILGRCHFFEAMACLSSYPLGSLQPGFTRFYLDLRCLHHAYVGLSCQGQHCWSKPLLLSSSMQLALRIGLGHVLPQSCNQPVERAVGLSVDGASQKL